MSTVLCRLDELADGRSHGFDPQRCGQDALFIVRQGGQLFAYRNACPHIDGAPMAWRRDAYLSADGRHIACHAHGALFEISTGLCVHGPCIGLRLEAVPLHIQPKGVVRIADENINMETSQ